MSGRGRTSSTGAAPAFANFVSSYQEGQRVNRMIGAKWCLGLAAACGGLAASSAQGATVYDLTAGGSATINGATYSTGVFQPAGTGVIDSFVRIQGNGNVVQGYNTGDRSYKESGEF